MPTVLQRVRSWWRKRAAEPPDRAFRIGEYPPPTPGARWAYAKGLSSDARVLQQRIRQLESQWRCAAFCAAWGTDIIPDYDVMLHRIQLVFHMPANEDLMIREFRAGGSLRAFAVFMSGMVDTEIVAENVITPLVQGRLPAQAGSTDVLDVLATQLIQTTRVERKEALDGIVHDVLDGVTALYVEGTTAMLLVETKKTPHRGIQEPRMETTVVGPNDAFTEAQSVNTALIRRFLRTPDLVSESFKLGTLSKTNVSVMYIDGVTNPSLVEEVRLRLRTVRTDAVLDAGILAELFEDAPTSALFPTVQLTERPDRTAAALLEGRVVILAGDSPFALIVPSTVDALIQSAADYYLRYPFGSLLRVVRVLGALIVTFTGPLYVALTNFHSEAIPSPLLLSMAASREAVPFPAPIEVLLLDVIFELIREAGLRVPKAIGPTLTIVGALILGQAAVEAGLVSAVLVIVVAVAGLSSFLIPSYAGSFTFRLLRFIFLALASIFGIFGIALGVLVLLGHAASLKSFGVPYLMPAAPASRRLRDLIIRPPAFSDERRPAFLRPLRSRRQPHVVRAWDPAASTAGQRLTGSGERR